MRFFINFDARRSFVHGLHLERSDGDDGYDGQQESEDQPLVLAQNDQVIEQVRLARNLIPGQDRWSGNDR